MADNMDVSQGYPREYYMSSHWAGDEEGPSPSELKGGGMSMKGTMDDRWAYETSEEKNKVPHIRGVYM